MLKVSKAITIVICNILFKKCGRRHV